VPNIRCALVVTASKYISLPQVSCITLSSTGRYLASGQKTYMGFTSDIIIWNLETRKIHKKLSLHKVMVQALAFSHDETKIASLGGPDDGSLVLWDVASGQAMCGSPANNKFVYCVEFFKNDNTRLVTAGQGAIPSERL
jgi:cilia- and flagella-associated protein 52